MHFTCLYFSSFFGKNISVLFLENFHYIIQHYQLQSLYYILDESESVAQSCPTLCDPVDCSPPGSSVGGLLQARPLEWVAIPFSRILFDSAGYLFAWMRLFVDP